MTTPVVLSKYGMMDLHNVNVETYIERVHHGSGSLLMKMIGAPYHPPNETLEIGEKKTIPFDYFIDRDHTLRIVSYADVALIVHFTPDYLPFIHRKRIFRFVTAQQADGTLRLEQQPSAGVEKGYEETHKIGFP